MKILIISQYFWPENFRVNDIAIEFANKNYSVDVLTTYPNYPGGKIYSDFKKNPKNYFNLKKVNVHRVPCLLRKNSSSINLFLNYTSFTLSSIFFGYFILRKKKYDTIFTFGTSPVTIAIVAIFFSKLKKTKTVLWLLDIWPNILFELNIIKNKYLKYLINVIMNYIYKNIDYILIQSKEFANFLPLNNLKNETIYLPSWPEDYVNSENLNLINKKEIEKDLIFFKDDYFKIVFTGNIGEAQNFDNIILTAEILAIQKIKVCWIIIGEGRAKEYYRKKIIKKNITNFYFIGSRNSNSIYFYHKNADALLISLKKGEALSSTIPGKLQTYLNSNKFILGFIDGESAKIIKSSKAGIVISPDNPEMFAQKIIEVIDNKTILKNRENINTTIYSASLFSKKRSIEILDDLFLKIENSYDQIKLITDPLYIPYNKNFILSGLNLAFLGFYIKGEIIINNNMYNWPDGIFFRRFYNFQYTKIAGRKLIINMQIPDFIKRIFILGNLTERSKNFMKEIFLNKEINHINLKYNDVNIIYEEIKFIKFKQSDIIFLTLPTPKQEQLANLIRKYNDFYKVICIGGAIEMASGQEKKLPLILENFNLEFIWRLRNDTMRRLKRLFISFYYYIIGEVSNNYSKLKIKTIDRFEQN